MARCTYMLAALLAASSVPAFGAITVVGSSSARMCFEAADSPMSPTARDMAYCDEAFQGESLSLHDTVATHVNRGILRLRRNQVEPAIADFDSAMRLDPDQPEAYLNKGAALIRMERNPDEALQLFTIAIDRQTRRPAVAHFGRAIANETLGNVRAAYNDYRRASELSPDWRDPRVELQRFRVVSN
ncbi:tetratricopeptide repeat protein [Sphingosinicella terrae]|uniref:tetratricopeptide repeat protein n=1 Tax=Sphingosinicella terrae TaxID=2172047 RepID=UPI0013B42878|nr:tetratricopeptide repeat protein [Sphingosinicella terrae]